VKYDVSLLTLYVADNGKSWHRQSSTDESETEGTNFYSVQTRAVFVEKPRRWRSEPRTSHDEEMCDRVARREAFILASREKRNPLLDHVKDTRLSCFPSTEILSNFPPEPIAPLPITTHLPHCEKFIKNPKTRKRNTQINESFNGNSCLSAKIKSISDRYLKCSTNRLFSKFNKNCDGSSQKAKCRRQRSLSYGSLPILEDMTHPLVHSEAPEVGADGGEDGDSGIMVADSSSMVEPVKIGLHMRSASNSEEHPSSSTSSALGTDSR